MSIIAAGTTSGTALVSTGDTNGTLVIQTNGTTVAATFGTDQSLTLVGALTIGSAAQAVPSGSAPLFAARAWVNFDGTGTVAIRASGNVSSITDNGTGDYTVNFTTAMPDANYSTVIQGQYAPTSVAFLSANLYSAGTYITSSVRFVMGQTNTAYDCAIVNVIISR